MKMFLVNALVAVFVIVGFTGQSWAFGSRHHSSSHGSNNGNQGDQGDSFSNGGNTEDGSDPFINNIDDGNGNFSDNDFHHRHFRNDDNGGNQDFNNSQLNFIDSSSEAPVPEPMTLPLLGLGLAGILLKRKMSRFFKA